VSWDSKLISWAQSLLGYVIPDLPHACPCARHSLNVSTGAATGLTGFPSHRTHWFPFSQAHCPFNAWCGVYSRPFYIDFFQWGNIKWQNKSSLCLFVIYGFKALINGTWKAEWMRHLVWNNLIFCLFDCMLTAKVTIHEK
jgi:hypothetical protein